MNPKILLVSAINAKNKMDLKYLPLGPAYLSSYIKKYSDVDEIVLANTNLDEVLKKFKPDIVGISSVSQNFNIAKYIAEKVKKNLDTLVILGGHHISALPNLLPETVDIGVIGEGEETLLEIVQEVSKNTLSKSLPNIAGIVFKNGSKIIINPVRKLIKPLDIIPFPARDLMSDFGSHVYMLTARGCPYKCSFCSSANYWKIIRFHSAEYIIAEILELVNKYNVKYINIYDDLFTADKKRLKQIVKFIVREKINKKVEFNVTCRANLINEEIIVELKKMNVKQVALGLESGSQRILESIKGSLSVKQNSKAIFSLKKNNIKIAASFIIGIPGEKRKDIMKTYNFIKKHPLDACHIYVMIPFPGTDIWEDAKKNNLVSDFLNTDKLNINFKKNYKQAIIVNKEISRKELYYWYNKIEKLIKIKEILVLLKKLLSYKFVLSKIKNPVQGITATKNFLGKIFELIK